MYMRLYWFMLAVLLCSVSASSAITVEEVARLVQLKTSDDVILQLVRESPPDQPLSPAQVIYLRENGVGDPILSALLQKTPQDGHPEILPKQDSESHWIDGAARYYYTTAEDGSKKMVVTNLDEMGRPMGPPPPPRREEPPPQEPVQEAYQAPQEYPVEPQRDAQFERGYMYPQYPAYDTYQGSMPYYDSYLPYGFIPDYPGSTFGFHLFPQFTVIQSSRGFSHHSFSGHHFSSGQFHPHHRSR